MSGFFQSFELTIWPQITLVLFMLIFLAVILWVYRPSGKEGYGVASQLPLEKKDLED